ncbi:MAG: hypothetical protein LBV02_04835 [Bacteroidales bacterium]|jgi:hypothetical protein|nr:hypothetical protein [Bacteroidales bacterium]
MIIVKELKEAIRRLTSEEKDKLIFRLLKKDVDLANRLLFELVSCDSMEDRRKDARKDIERCIGMTRSYITYTSPGMMLMDMRGASGYVNEHVRITKDRYGEVELHLFILKEYLKMYNEYFKDTPADRAFTLNIYLVARAFKIMVLLKKMHEDLMCEFADDLEETGRLFADNPGLMKVAIHNGLDVNWLIGNKIPDHIDETEKDLRKRGYLK